jgi:hypothetical protein
MHACLLMHRHSLFQALRLYTHVLHTCPMFQCFACTSAVFGHAHLYVCVVRCVCVCVFVLQRNHHCNAHCVSVHADARLHTLKSVLAYNTCLFIHVRMCLRTTAVCLRLVWGPVVMHMRAYEYVRTYLFVLTCLCAYACAYVRAYTHADVRRIPH